MKTKTKSIQGKKTGEPQEFMREAVKQASAGIKKGHGGPFGAVIVRGGKVIARAHNRVVENKDPTAHAEVVAIRKASKKLNSWDLSGCELYTTCEPCPMCLASIMWAGIKKVYFGCTRKDAENIGFNDSRFYKEMAKICKAKDSSEKESALKYKSKVIELAGTDSREECLNVFKEWKKSKGKVIY